MSEFLNEKLTTLSGNIASTLTDDATIAGGDPFQGSNKISESSSHDFTHYLFALDPLTRNSLGAAISSEEEALFLAVIGSVVGATIPRNFVVSEVVEEGNWGGGTSGSLSSFNWERQKDPFYNSNVLSQKLFRIAFIPYCINLIGASLTRIDVLRRTDYVTELALKFRDNLSAAYRKIEWPEELSNKASLITILTSDKNIWKKAIIEALEAVPRQASTEGVSNKTQTYGSAVFTPFEPQTVNFGLQLVYRQVWLPKGVQTGDIVKTIPLGPGQKEKVTIKSIRRQQRKRSFENTRTIEQSSENVSSSRDSSEVVSEASSSSNWNVEVSAEASFGTNKAGISASTGGEQERSSRDFKTKANEAMQKAADKLRTETKVIVETNLDDTDSIERVSEIYNDNDETAVTYVYSKLQRQYEVYTYLAEVNSVAYVAENVVTDLELSHHWIEKHASVMRRALLDPSLESDLERVLGRPYFLDDEPKNEAGLRDTLIVKMMDNLAAKDLPDYSTARGTPPDTITSVLAQYQSDKTEALARHNDYKSYQQSLQRLIAHISANALHYSKAIWGAESSDLRMMRYRNILVPQDWTETNPVGNGYGAQDKNNPNIFVPVISEQSPLVSLTDMINPAGPVGLAGNYLAFDLKDSKTIKHIDAPLSLLRSSYSQKITWFEPSEGMEFIGLIKPSFVYPSQELTLAITGNINSDNTNEVIVTLYTQSQDGTLDNIGEEVLSVSQDGRVEGNNISGLLLKNKEPSVSLSSDITLMGKSVLTTHLEDPDYSAYKYAQFVTTYANAKQILSLSVIKKLKEQYSEHVNDISLSENVNVEALDSPALTALIELYLMDQFVTSNTRKVLVDTDNVVLSRIVDNASSLEPYKAAHRKIDLLKTIEELQQDISESERYDRRLNEGHLDDPETDSLIKVEGQAHVDVNP